MSLDHPGLSELVVDFSSSQLAPPRHGHHVVQQAQSSTGTEEYHPVQHGQSGRMVEEPATLCCGHNSKSSHHDGHSTQPSPEELRGHPIGSGPHHRHFDGQLTSSHSSSEAQARSPSTAPSFTSFHDSCCVSSYSVHYVSQSFLVLRFSHYPSSAHASFNHPWSQSQSKIEGVPISTTYGARRWNHTSFSPKTFFCPIACICALHTSPIFNPNSTLGRLFIMYLTESTVALGSIYYQLTHDRLVQAELALRFWREHQNLFVWAPIPLFACRSDFRCLELALIQEWQPGSPD